MKKKSPVPFSQRFPKVDPTAIRLLERLLAFNPKDRPSAVEVKILYFDCCGQRNYLPRFAIIQLNPLSHMCMLTGSG